MDELTTWGEVLPMVYNHRIFGMRTTFQQAELAELLDTHMKNSDLAEPDAEPEPGRLKSIAAKVLMKVFVCREVSTLRSPSGYCQPVQV